MAAGNISRVLRAPGRLVVAPSEAFGELVHTYPYGGTEIGKVNLCSLTPAGRPPFLVEYEALGSPGEILEGDVRWLFACFVRAWDRDAVAQFLSEGYAKGDYTQHAVYSVPGTVVPGSSAITRGIVLAYIPDDEIHVPGAILYHAVPNWTPDAEMAFRRGDELGIPLTFECMRDSTDRVLQMGRMADLSL